MIATHVARRDFESTTSSPTLLSSETRSRLHRLSYLSPDLLAIPKEEDEVDFDETVEITLAPVRPTSELTVAANTPPPRRTPSRQYKFVRLEQTLTSAKLLDDSQDREQFEHDYRQALQENNVEDFFRMYYRKLHAHKEALRRERMERAARTFTFVDLEKNFLASDPTRDIKIVFVNNSHRKFLSPNSTNNPSATATQLEDAAVEAFYENLSRRFLDNPSRAREQITLFARQAGERLQDSLPCLSRVPYRVKLIDERDKEQPLDERALLQLKHKQNMSVIARRRQLFMNMVTQTRKNQGRMREWDKKRPTLAIDTSTYCQELLAQVHDFEESLKDKPPRTTSVVQRADSRSRASSVPSKAHRQTPSPPVLARSKREAISMRDTRQSAGVRVVQSTWRPLTGAVQRPHWSNYC